MNPGMYSSAPKTKKRVKLSSRKLSKPGRRKVKQTQNPDSMMNNLSMGL